MVQPHVDYCITCQPWDGGEAIWIHGDQLFMANLLDHFEVPKDLQEEVASQLQCNNCGAPLDSTSYVGVKSAAEREEEERREQCWTAWMLEYEPKLKDFIQSLSLYPYLGCDHPFGRHILEEIPRFPAITISDESWWRARKPEGAQRFSAIDLYPPEAPSSEGRYSHYGQQVFYLASTAEAAGREVLKDNEGLFWAQKFRVRDIPQILDLYHYVDEQDDHVSILAFGLDHTDVHREPANPRSPWKPQYFLPRFIADCARRNGYQGIQFQSRAHDDRNLVLFQWSESQIEPIGDPMIIDLKGRKRDLAGIGHGQGVKPTHFTFSPGPQGR
jgi:hypothetical protein